MQNSIERTIEIAAPIQRVWQALTDHQEFGEWFKVELESSFEEGEITKGVVTYPGCEGMKMWVKTLRLDAPNHFSFRWPFDEHASPSDADDPSVTTLVEFTLKSLSSGTQLTIVESGFDGLPEDKRVTAFRDNEGGWQIQSENIRRYAER